jgi:hypothetical protein
MGSHKREKTSCVSKVIFDGMHLGMMRNPDMVLLYFLNFIIQWIQLHLIDRVDYQA